MRQDDLRTGEPYDHVVVGSGLSGLAYAWRRMREGRTVLVVEAADRPGGSLETVRTNGFTIDRGGAVVLGAAPYLEALLDAVPGSGRLTPAGSEPLHAWLPAGLSRPSASAWARLRRRPGVLADEVRARLGGDRPPPTVSPRLVEGGVDTLTGALASALGDVLRRGVRAERVRPRGEQDPFSTVVVDEGAVACAREVALDVDATEQARLLGDDLPHHADVLAAVRHEEVAEVAVATSGRPLPPIPGYARAPGMGGRVEDALFASNLDPGRAPAHRGLVLLSIAERVARALDDETLGRVAVADLERALGRTVGGEVVGVCRRRRPRPERGHRGRVAALAADLGGRGVRLLGRAALGDALDRLASAGVPVPGPLPKGASIA